MKILTPAQIDELRRRSGLTPETEWERFPPGSPEAFPHVYGPIDVAADRIERQRTFEPRQRILQQDRRDERFARQQLRCRVADATSGG